MKKIDQGLKTYDYLLLCYSSSSVDAPWIRREWSSALARQLEKKGGLVIPVCLTGQEGPTILGDLKPVDLMENWSSGLASLLDVLACVCVVHATQDEASAVAVCDLLETHGLRPKRVALGSAEVAGGAPVIFCLTPTAAGTRSAVDLVATARRRGQGIYGLLMDDEASSLLLGEAPCFPYHADPAVSIRELATKIKPPPIPGTPPAHTPVAEDDLATYCAWAMEKYGHVAMIGVGGSDLTLDLAKVYIPLRISQRTVLADLEQRKGSPAEMAGQQSDGDVALTRIFAVGRQRHAALFGDPGAGKSTALRKLLHHCLLEGASVLELPDGTIPLFLRLRRFAEPFLNKPLSAFIQHELNESSGHSLPTGLGKRLWKRGKLLLLLDGLDEIASQGLRGRVARKLDDALLTAWSRNIHAVVSCRYAGYGGTVRLGNAFLHLDVRPLDADQVEDFVRLWFQEAHGSLPKGDPLQAGQESAKLLENLRQPHHANRQIQLLVGNPLLLTLLCVVVLQKYEIPRRRVEFYRQCLEVLLYRWRHLQEGEEPPLTPEMALSVLRRMAWEMHTAGRQYDMTAQEFADLAAAVLDQQGHAQPLPDGGLRWFHLTCGVLEEYAPRHYGFMHLGFQEYLAAQHVAAQRQTLVAELVSHRGEEWWKEVILLTAGLEDGDLFVHLVKALLPGVGQEEGAEWLRAVLAEAPLINLTPFEERLDIGTPGEQSALLRLLRGRSNHRLREIAERLASRTDSEEVRAQANRFLDRPAAAALAGPTTNGAAPALEIFIEPRTGLRLLPVPGGIFTMGSLDGHEDERPPHPVRLSPYWLAETPVTNRHYGLYLQATRTREPAQWRDRRFSDPEQPVVGVDWADAVAFCRWLSEGMARGLTCTLPSEAQWEFAARGMDGRPYPWGGEKPTKERVCFGLDLDSGKPVPVGSFPSGRGPFGHLDLAGNVWEWCRDGWSRDYHRWVGQMPDNPVVTEGDGRVVRGGSWFCPADGLRAAYRDRFPAGDRVGSLGFRVAAAPSSTLDI
ncbi:MAG: SUMF1/EgtB/PvdO family nonheme iron enzyme [Magnetococcus sp. MYC-9]